MGQVADEIGCVVTAFHRDECSKQPYREHGLGGNFYIFIYSYLFFFIYIYIYMYMEPKGSSVSAIESPNVSTADVKLYCCTMT